MKQYQHYVVQKRTFGHNFRLPAPLRPAFRMLTAMALDGFCLFSKNILVRNVCKVGSRFFNRETKTIVSLELSISRLDGVQKYVRLGLSSWQTCFEVFPDQQSVFSILY